MAKSKDTSKSKTYSAFSLVAAIAAASVAKKGLNTTWRATTGKNPPANPADPDVGIAEAVMFAALSGTLIGVVRMLATRRAANYYTRSTGHLPPQLQKDGQDAKNAPAAQS